MIDLNRVGQSIRSINFLELSNQTGNIYKTVAVLGRRSNQISLRLREQLHSKLQEFSPSSDSLEEFQENREQIEIAKHFEQIPKPTLIALCEFLDKRLVIRDPEEDSNFI